MTASGFQGISDASGRRRSSPFKIDTYALGVTLQLTLLGEDGGRKRDIQKKGPMMLPLHHTEDENTAMLAQLRDPAASPQVRPLACVVERLEFVRRRWLNIAPRRGLVFGASPPPAPSFDGPALFGTTPQELRDTPQCHPLPLRRRSALVGTNLPLHPSGRRPGIRGGPAFLCDVPSLLRVAQRIAAPPMGMRGPRAPPWQWH